MLGIRQLNWISHPSVIRAFVILFLYASWQITFRLVFITLLTFFSVTPTTRISDISELLANYEILIAGSGSILFFIFWIKIFPTESWLQQELQWNRATRLEIGTGLLKGFLFGISLMGGLIVSGRYEFLGFYVQMEEAWLGVVTFISRFFLLLGWIYAEEFLFRRRVLSLFRKALSSGIALLITSLFFTVLKAYPFELDKIQLANVFIVSLLLSYWNLEGRHFGYGAAAISGFLIILHPLFGIPLFGVRSSGFLLLRSLPPLPGESESLFFRVLSGGDLGPLSGAVVLAITCILLVRSLAQNQKILFDKPSG